MHEVPVDLTKATNMAPHTDNGSAGWTTPGRIPEAAVEAAAIRLYGKHRKDDRALRRLTFLALEAAAPHMLAGAYADGYVDGTCGDPERLSLYRPTP